MKSIAKLRKGTELLDATEGDLLGHFSAFLDSPLRNAWLYGDKATIYVRKGMRCLGVGLVATLDVGVIEVTDDMRCRGLGSALISHIHDNNPFAATYIENILTARFLRRLKRDKWVVVDPNDYSPSVYKLTGH